MTLILGLRCADGTVIVSDREESGGSIKRSVPKIFDSSTKRSSLAIGGAGHAALCDVAIERIRVAANKSGEAFITDHQSVISLALKQLHAEYIWNSGSLDDRRIALIIEVHDRDKAQHHFYLTCEEILQPKIDYACSGSGVILGDYFMERLYDPSIVISEADKLVKFIAREAKDSVGGVGRETEIVALDDKGVVRSWFSRSQDREIPHLANCLDKFWKH